MRPSLTTLAGMTVAAGTLVVAGSALVGAGAASAQVDGGLFDTPAPVEYVIEFDSPNETVLPSEGLFPYEVGVDTPELIVDPIDGSETDWYQQWGDDHCPACGMG